MSNAVTKHRPGYKTQLPPSNAPMRSVERAAPLHNDGSVDCISLGSREPHDGRYVSLVRSNFQHRPVQPCGEVLVEPLAAEVITLEKQQRSLQNGERQYFLGPSEDELNRFMHESVARSSPAPSMHSRSLTPALSSVDEVRKNAEAMRACHMFVSTTDQDGWKRASGSTMRNDIGKGVATAKTVSSHDRQLLRDTQRATHFALGFHGLPSTSESRGQYQGVQTERLRPVENASSSLQLGMSTVNVKDTLRSLKQVDFLPTEGAIRDMQEEKIRQSLAGESRNVVNAETDSLVLGYAGGDKRSLYRASYTPVHFSPSPKRSDRRT